MSAPRPKRNAAGAGRRVGFLSASIHTGVSPQLWLPLTALADRDGVELFIFPGGRLAAEDPAEAIRTRVYSLASARNLDGAVSWASSLGGFVGAAGLDAFHARLGGLPLVTMAHRVPGKPVIRIDAYSGMRALAAHMIEVHGVRRFAFIRGPAEHESAEDRLRAFLDAQRAAGIEPDPRMTASPRPWNEGQAAVEELLDERGLIPGRDFDALLAASDLQLYSAVLLLQGRGYVIPGDLLTAGFNDSIESRILSPAVTTVRLPFAEQSERAYRALLSLFAGVESAVEEILPSELVVRQSCGCVSASVREAGKRPAAAGREGLRGAILSAAAKSCGAGLEERSAWLKPLAGEFAAALESPDVREPGAVFLRTLDRVMERLIGMGRDLASWQDVLSAFRAETLARVSPRERERVEELIGQGRVIVSEALVRANAVRTWKAAGIAQALRDLERDLIRLDDRGSLGSVLAAHLPALGIRAAYVAEENGEGSAARLIAGFDEQGVLQAERGIDSRGLVDFDGADLLPPGILPPPSGRSWVVEPLCAGDGYFGRLVVHAGSADGSVYEELRGALSSALQGLRSIDEIKRARAAAEKAEALKSRFLASVSGELREPLKGIAASVETVSRAVSGDRKGARLPAAVARSLEFIRGAAERQLTLTDDLLDLARCEAGDLQLESALVRPDALVDRARAVAESAAAYHAGENALPLVSGDFARLARLLALLFDRSRPAELSVRVEPCFLAFSVVRSDGGAVPPEDEGALGRSVAFARRLVAAHLGRLEPITTGGRTVGWTLRLPYPTLGGGIRAAEREAGRVLLLADDAKVPAAVAEALALGPDRLAVVSPARLRAEPGLLAGVAALAWSPPPPPREAAEASIIRALSKSGPAAALPFLLFPIGLAGDWPGLAGLVAELAGSEEAGAVIVCDGDADRGAALASGLAASFSASAHDRPLPEPLAANSPEEVNSLTGVPPAVVILRSPEAVPAIRRGDRPERRAPTLLMLCGLLDGQVDLSALEADPRAVLLNEGVLTAGEFGRFVRSLAEGRAILPSYTGAIVKRAQLFMNRRFPEPVSRWQIAEEVSVSEDYLTRIFKKELGLSPWEYLTRLRIHAARRLLRESGESLKRVAEAVGFHDQAYFCRVFRKVEGCSPSEYRGVSPG